MQSLQEKSMGSYKTGLPLHAHSFHILCTYTPSLNTRTPVHICPHDLLAHIHLHTTALTYLVPPSTHYLPIYRPQCSNVSAHSSLDHSNATER